MEKVALDQSPTIAVSPVVSPTAASQIRTPTSVLSIHPAFDGDNSNMDIDDPPNGPTFESVPSIVRPQNDTDISGASLEGGNDESFSSPISLRKRKPLSAAFDPSQCPQCGTGSMCNRCRTLKDKEIEAKVSALILKQPAPPPAVTNVVHDVAVPTKQSKKSADHQANKKTGVSKSVSKTKGERSSTPKPLTGAAAHSHARRLDREKAEQKVNEDDSNDLSKSSKMFAFVERFFQTCPEDSIDSLVKLNSGESQMTSFGNLTYRQLAQHLYGLRVEHVQRLMRPVLHRLMIHPKNVELFNTPVDPEALDIPTYFLKIKNPMDLGTVKSKLQRGGYQDIEDCLVDIDLVFNNAMMFNPSGHVVYECAKTLSNDFHGEEMVLKERLEKEAERKSHHACSLCMGSCCYLCGEKCLRVEPPILVCHGPCGQKIKKNCVYYVSRDGLMLWCQKCHMGLPVVASEPTGRGKLPILKKDLLKRRLDEEVAESWVQCDTCQRWVHQVCALFNERYESLTAEDLSYDPTEPGCRNKNRLPSRVLSVSADPNVDDCVRFECPLCKIKEPIGERVVVDPLPLPPPPLSPPRPDPIVPEILPVVELPPVPVVLSVSKHGRNRKRPTALGDEYILIPLKQSHVAKAVSIVTPIDALKQKKRGRPEGSVNKPKHAESKSNLKKGGKKDAAPKKKRKLSAVSEKATVGEIVYYKPVGRRGRKPKYRVNLGNPQTFNTNLGYAATDYDEAALSDAEGAYDSHGHAMDDNTHSSSAELDSENKVAVLGSSTVGDESDRSDMSDDEECANSENSDSCSRTSGIVGSAPASPKNISFDHKPCELQEKVNYEAVGDNKMDVDDIEHSIGFDSTAMDTNHPEEVVADEAGIKVEESEVCKQAGANPVYPVKVRDIKTEKSPLLDKILSDFGHRQWTAAGLPQTHLGDFLEHLVRTKLEQTEKHSRVAGSVFVRMISNTIQKLEVPTALRENFPTPSGAKLPHFIPYRQKCILLFQTIQGNDICLFCLYVQEFDDKCPEPNRSRVYIAYLDSIEYFRPRECRTLVYHEILAGYLKWVQARGFQHCHIWACPPQRGDNFIFWSHPPHQRTPSRDRLTSWYNLMLRRAGALNVFASDGLSNAWSIFFKKYGRRENDSTQARQSTRQISYAAAGRGSKKRGRGGRKSSVFRGNAHPENESEYDAENIPAEGELAADVVTSLHRSTSVDSIINIVEGDDDSRSKTLIQPVCPPVFEGDFWVNECIRIHRFMESRAKAATTGLNAASTATGVGPLADKLANQRAARDVMKRIMTKPLSYPFLLPVDPVALNIPDYLTIVKHPMDLGTIKGKLKTKSYPTLFEFAEDMRLIFANSILYNPASHPIHLAAVEFVVMLSDLLVKLVTDRLGSILTPPADSSTDGLDIWLKKFKLSGSEEAVSNPTLLATAGGEAVDEVATQAIKAPEPVDLDNLGSNQDDVNIATRADSAGNLDNEQCDYAFADDGSCGESKSDAGDRSDGGDVADSSCPQASLEPMYPAPIGFCRQDSALDFHHSPKTAEDAISYRTSAVLAEGSQMTTAGTPDAFANVVDTEIKSERVDVKAEGKNVLTTGSLSTGSADDSVFHAPAMGLKGVCSLMHELSKASLRFKDDLFVMKLSSSPMTSSGDNPNCDSRELWREWLMTSNMNSEIFLSYFDGIITQGDTSDPDALMASPFVGSRHTFLEMCQYRHYQFDSLRRAKHSSMMLLYHLHRPYQASLRPVCVSCKATIKHIRWHCELCDHYDLCGRCVAGKIGAEHQHPLIPFRVTYV